MEIKIRAKAETKLKNIWKTSKKNSIKNYHRSCYIEIKSLRGKNEEISWESSEEFSYGCCKF